MLLLYEGNTGGPVGGGYVTLAFSGVGGPRDLQLRSKDGAYAVVAEGSTGIGRLDGVVGNTEWRPFFKQPNGFHGIPERK